MTKSTNSRIGWIDALKGFTILMVVLGHTLQRYYDDQQLIVRIVYSFHIPLFMFLSGYVSYKVSSWANIRKRGMQLLIPFFSQIVISYLIYCGVQNWSALGFYQHAETVILRPDQGLWFLWTLFFINAIFIGCRKLSSFLHLDERLVAVSVAGILNIVELITRFELFGYHWIAWYFVFFSLGVYWRMYDNGGPHPVTDQVVSVGSLVAFPVLVLFFRMHNEAPLFYRWIDLGPYFPIAYRMLVGIVGSLFFLRIFKIFHIDNFILTKLGGGNFRHLLSAFFRVALFRFGPVVRGFSDLADDNRAMGGNYCHKLYSHRSVSTDPIYATNYIR